MKYIKNAFFIDRKYIKNGFCNIYINFTFCNIYRVATLNDVQRLMPKPLVVDISFQIQKCFK